MTSDYYHSALSKKSLRHWPRVQRHEGVHGLAFQHDILSGVHSDFLAADILYSELPWVHGFDIFAKRAGAIRQKNSYREFLRFVGRIVLDLKRPSILLTGKHAVNDLRPHVVLDVKLNGGKAVACLWSIPPWKGCMDCFGILRDLAQRFACVVDFCCGYGRAGRIFAENGKRYVMSDFNAECIGYIALMEKSWAPCPKSLPINDLKNTQKGS